ncbi:hypothetical protein G6F58_013244 [Rhizopus delemar]|nr:hypothetical protein G6F58_013244 [Rhizopus delemar]
MRAATDDTSTMRPLPCGAILASAARPALATSASSLSRRWTAASAAARSVTSNAIACAADPCARNSSAKASGASRSASTSAAPCSAQTRAVSLPMPPAAPVIRMVLPSSA